MQGIEAVHHCTFWGGGGASADMNELRLTAEWHAMAALSCFAQRNALPRGQSNLGLLILRSTTGGCAKYIGSPLLQ